MSSCNQPISLCKLLRVGMGCLHSHQYLMKNQGNFGRCFIHKLDGLMNLSIMSSNNKRTSIEMMNFLLALQFFPV